MLDRLIDLIVQFFELFKFAAVLRPYEKAIIYRFGKTRKVCESPGIYFHLPLKIEEVVKVNYVLDSIRLPVQRFTTADGVSVSVQATVTFTIDEPETYFNRIENAESVMTECAPGVILDALSPLTWDDIRARRAELCNEIAKDIRRNAKRWGFGVSMVQFTQLVAARAISLIMDRQEI